MNRFGVLNLLIAIGLVAAVSAIDCDGPRPERIDLRTCCPHDDLISAEIKEQCKSYLDSEDDATPPPGSGPRGPKHHKNPCYMECVLNATGVMNDYDVDEAKLKTYLTSTLATTPDFIPIVEAAFEKCVQKGKEMREKMGNPPPPPPGQQCKPCSAMLLFCVKAETVINCPENLWKNDDACNTHREFMQNCKPPHPHHHGPRRPQN